MSGDPARLLDPGTGWKPMAVPALWEHRVVPPHPLVSCHKVDATSVKRVSDVQIVRRLILKETRYPLQKAWQNSSSVFLKIYEKTSICVHPC